MPELVKWVNGGKFDGGLLSPEQRELREWYGRLIQLTREPAFTRGEFYGLNHANKDNPAYGRLDGERTSGHWLYAYLRYDSGSRQAFLVIANFHGFADIADARLRLPEHALGWLGIGAGDALRFEERLAEPWAAGADAASLPEAGLPLPPLPPLSARIIELSR